MRIKPCFQRKKPEFKRGSLRALRLCVEDWPYLNEPGDLPHFFVTRDAQDVGSEEVEGLETVADLVAWLREHAVAVI